MIRNIVGALLCLFSLGGCASHSLLPSAPSSHALPTHFALLLPFSGHWSTQGTAVRDGFFRAYYESPTHDQQTISIYDTAKGIPLHDLYQQALSEGADFIIGPLMKDDVQTLLSERTLSIPILALNYTTVPWGGLPEQVYEFGLSPANEAMQMAHKAWEAGFRRALVIAPKDNWGERLSKPLISQWQSLGGNVSDSFYYSPASDLSTDIPHLLKTDTTLKSIRPDIDVIFLLAQPSAGRAIVPLLKYNYGNHLAIYASSAIYTGIPDPLNDADLNGVYFCDIPWMLNVIKQDPVYRGTNNRMMAIGYDAYLISNHLSELITQPAFTLSGETGKLMLTAQHQIFQQLSWSQIREGRPQ